MWCCHADVFKNSVVKHCWINLTGDVFPTTSYVQLLAGEALEKHIRSKQVVNRSLKKKWACTLCDYSTDIKTGLRRHILTHTKAKPHKCGECGKCFTRQDSLTRHHKSIHTKESKYKCDFCSKTYTRHCGLLRHIQAVHDKTKCFVWVVRSKCASCRQSTLTADREREVLPPLELAPSVNTNESFFLCGKTVTLFMEAGDNTQPPIPALNTYSHTHIFTDVLLLPKSIFELDLLFVKWERTHWACYFK